MQPRKRFLLYCDWENLIKDMSDSDVASLTRWIFIYQNTGEIWDMSYWAKIAFSFIQPVFDEDRKDWEKTSKTNSKNAKDRWDRMRNNTNKSDFMRPHTTESEPMCASTDGIGIDKTETDISKDIWEQALEILEKKEIEKIDNRNKRTQRIVDIVKDQVKKEWYIYDDNREERNRATIIAKRQKDWWDFIWTTSEEDEERVIRAIIEYSNQNEYSAKIRSVKDFHEKWKKVANSMKEKNKKSDETFIPSF